MLLSSIVCSLELALRSSLDCGKFCGNFFLQQQHQTRNTESRFKFEIKKKTTHKCDIVGQTIKLKT